MGKFGLGMRHAALDLRGIIAARDQALTQFGERGRPDEHADDIPAQGSAQLAEALPVDVEQNVLPRGQGDSTWPRGVP